MKRLAYVTAIGAGLLSSVAQAQTVPGLKLSAESEYYRYNEPGLDHQDGPGFGLGASYTFKFGAPFLTFDALADIYHLDYNSSGSGKVGGITDVSGDIRALGGLDFRYPTSGVGVSPYLGLGYRVLFDAGAGKNTDQGFAGYDRLSQYLYLPLGVTVSEPYQGWTFRQNAEFDYLIRGWQQSDFTQVGYDSDIINEQPSGFGLRFSLTAETPTEWGLFSVGPYARLWNIRASELTTAYQGGVAVEQDLEPPNHTLEAGLKIGLGF